MPYMEPGEPKWTWTIVWLCETKDTITLSYLLFALLHKVLVLVLVIVLVLPYV
jgi:hypothetical protein